MVLDSLLYLSDGKLPSPLADSIQITKMSEAFGQHLPHFELVASGGWRSLFAGQMEQQFATWYGVQSPFKLTRLPILGRAPAVFDPESYAPRGYIKAALAYARWLKQYAAWRRWTHVVYTRTPFFVPLLLQQRHPLILEYHEPLVSRAFEPSLWRHPQFLGMVTTGQELAQGYQALGARPEHVCVQPNAAAAELFLPAQTQAEARQTLTVAGDLSGELSGDRPILAYAGQLYDYKGIPLILSLAARLPHCHFLLVGGTPEDVNRIRSQAATRQLTNVQLTGHVSQPQLPTYLYAADILLLPTSQQWEQSAVTSPLKLFDYMSVQRPIVAAHLPNIATILRDGHNGRLAEPDNVDAFIEAIADLLNHPQQAQDLARQAYAEVKQRTWTNRAQQVIHFIEKRLKQA
ncbi:MAG: glycosyltransferase [Cyanobacteria bacterium P01_G01_bin.54]